MRAKSEGFLPAVWNQGVTGVSMFVIAVYLVGNVAVATM